MNCMKNAQNKENNFKRISHRVLKTHNTFLIIVPAETYTKLEMRIIKKTPKENTSLEAAVSVE